MLDFIYKKLKRIADIEKNKVIRLKWQKAILEKNLQKLKADK